MNNKRNRSSDSIRLIPKDLSESLGKTPPQDVELEARVLGGLMLESRSVSAKTILTILKPDDLYNETHRIIFEACLQLHEDDNPVTLSSVKTQLKKNGKLEIIGGPYALAQMTDGVSSASDPEFNCRVLKELAMKRDLISLASMIHHDAYEDTTDAFELLDKLQAHYSRMILGLSHTKVTTIKEQLTKLTLEIQDRKPDMPAITGVPSGFNALDRLLLGWQKTDLIIIAARPGMGKTSFVVTVLRNAAVMFKIPVMIFSLEMGASQLTQKFASMDSEIPLRDIRSKPFEAHTWAQWMHKTAELAAAPIYMDDTAALPIVQFKSTARKYVEQFGVRLIVVDYLQLMRGDPHSRGREEEVASISRALKQVAKELDVPVIALSQLARATEQRGGTKEPNLSDLRESGSIEQDADIVAFLWRPEYYKIHQDADGRPFEKGITKVSIAKHRNGPPGETFVRFNERSTKFENAETPYAYGDATETVPDNLRRLTGKTDNSTLFPKPPSNEEETDIDQEKGFPSKW